MGTSIERNDPGFMNHLAMNHDVAWRLNNLVVAGIPSLEKPDASRTETQTSLLRRAVFSSVGRMKLTPRYGGDLFLLAFFSERRHG